MEPFDYFSYDSESGEWRNNLTGYRFVLLGEPFYLNMVLKLVQQFGSAAGVFLYQSGLGVGEEMGRLVLQAPDAVTGLEQLYRNIFIAGWGKMSLEKTDIELLYSKKPITIIEENGFYSYLAITEEAEPLTKFITGVLIGVFDTIRNSRHVCEREQISEEPLMYRYILSPLA